jgi:hypothetical protein
MTAPTSKESEMTHLTPIRGLRAACLFVPLLVAGPALAYDFNITTPNQQDFHSVAQDLTGAFDYKALGGAAPGGLLGFSIEGFGSYTKTLDRGAWERLTGNKVDGIGIAGVRASKGLPGGMDVGAFYTRVPGTNASAYGAEVRYALLEGTVATPALALRATYTGAGNTGDFNYKSFGAEALISKGFVVVTPYAGAGYVRSETKADQRFGLAKEGIGHVKGFAGLGFKLLLLDGGIEYERLGHNNVYSLKLGVGF